jgi:glucose-6-phosphate dehydrogenase assembly protein OpcA
VLAAAVTTTLWDTTGTEIARALTAERLAAGAVAAGLAVTLVVVTEERRIAAAEEAATTAAAAHPCRLLVVLRRQPDASTARLDAEVSIGGRLGPTEAVVMRMYGRLALHADSVVLPLLASDAPVITWWHGPPPNRIRTDPLGRLADRRVTDVAAGADPMAALRQRAADYVSGDTDLSWARITPWRALLASALDASPGRPTEVAVEGRPDDPGAALLVGWLTDRLGVPISRTASPDGAVHAVSVGLRDDDAETVVRVQRCDERSAVLQRSGQPDRLLPLRQRPLGELLAEEVRRLDPDPVYEEALRTATRPDRARSRAAARR